MFEYFKGMSKKQWLIIAKGLLLTSANAFFSLLGIFHIMTLIWPDTLSGDIIWSIDAWEQWLLIGVLAVVAFIWFRFLDRLEKPYREKVFDEIEDEWFEEPVENAE